MHFPRKLPLSLLAVPLLVAATAARADTVDLDAKARDIAKSLAIVEFTLQDENQSSEGSGQGIVISKDGVILISGELISENTPKDWVKEIKIRLPSKNFANPIPATFLGRTRNGLFAFLKANEPIDAPVFTPPSDMPTPKLGEEIFAVGLMGKGGSYAPSVGVSRVKTILRLRRSAACAGSFNLTCANSPVFDAQTGAFLGITLGNNWNDGMYMTDGTSFKRVYLRDEEQGNSFYLAEDVARLFKNIPTKPFKLDRPWLGADEITGLQENLVALKKIDQTSGVMIGSAIAGEAADKAGLKSQDIILTVDGKPFSTSPIPEIMVAHFGKTIETYSPGDTVTFGILRDDKKQTIKATLGAAPKIGAEMPHVFSPKVGIVTRDLVFADAYARRLPQDTKGVMVALVKTGAPANLGSTPLRTHYLITKVNDQPVENQKQFLELMKKLEDNADAKEAVFQVIQPNGQSEVCRVDLSK
ncbi:MAG: PDZ domain-containing protein [Phycisphaerales bacterium]|nr:PDZ domain-containing protein [Phycisphaerales bacterium]